MKTLMLLMTQYDGRAMIPLAAGCRALFACLARLLRHVPGGHHCAPIVLQPCSAVRSSPS